MQKILFPTDFSKNAANAMQYAIGLANHFGSELLLLHVYWTPKKSVMGINLDLRLREDAQEKMDALVGVVALALTSGARLKSKVLKGDSRKTIERIAKTQGVDLIVMGTQGDVSHPDAFLGNTSGAMLRYTSLPMLVVPNGFSYRPPHTIGLVTKTALVGIQAILDPLRQMAIGFGSKVIVGQIEAANRPEPERTGEQIQLEPLKTTWQTRTAVTVREGVMGFAEENACDLVAAIRRRRDFFENFFAPNMIWKKDFECPVPVLVLPGER